MPALVAILFQKEQAMQQWIISTSWLTPRYALLPTSKSIADHAPVAQGDPYCSILLTFMV